MSALTGDPLLLMAATVGCLLVLVPIVVAVTLVSTGNAPDVGGAATLALLAAVGGYVSYDLLRRGGAMTGFAEFARVNGLELVERTRVTHYAGSWFADGSSSVHHAVRTRGERFVEVGDRFGLQPGNSRESNGPALYLRMRLAGRAVRSPREAGLITSEMDDALTALTGAYTVEVSEAELTVFGATALGIHDSERLSEAFRIAEALAARADQVLVGGPSEPSPPRQSERARRPAVVIGVTLGLLVTVSIVIAVLVSLIDDDLSGNEAAARVVVGIVVGTALAVVGYVVGRVVSPRR